MQIGEPAKLKFAGTARFQVLSEAGEGGAGFVYEVLDRERNAHLALKTLRTRNADAILELKNEFRAAQDLHHPNLVTLDELFEEGGKWFFTMEYVPGQNFLAHVRTGESIALASRPSGSFDEAKLRAALGQIAKGLCALHGSHKVHRDIKPSNILVTAEGRVVILDFGIMSDSASRQNEDEGIVGTVNYMAPEQAASEAIGPAADWYAVGAMLYEALTGQLPFAGTMSEVLQGKVMGEPPAPNTLVPELPADLNDLCVDLLRLDASERPEGLEILARLGVKAEHENRPLRHASFVGRRSELEAIEQAFEATRSGQTVSVLVEGESGVGKSYLVGEFTNRVTQAEDVLLLRGRCYERESVPYKAVDGIVDDLSRFFSGLSEAEIVAFLPPQAGLLRRLFPVLDRVATIADSRNASFESQDPQETRARVFAVLRELLANLAKRKRLVLVIDDLQWADADSLALLSDVLRPPNAPPLLLLATMRSGTERRRKGSALFGAIARLPGDVRHLHLEALPTSDARELLSQLLVGTDDAQQGSTIEAILAEAKGHPLFIDELVRHRGAHGSSAAPSRLDDALWDRASLLGPAERRLLEIVAIAGVPLSHETIAKAASLEFGELFAIVSTLRAGHFVRTSGVYRSDTIEPYHDRIRESVVGHTEDSAKKDWHGRLALALEGSEAADPEMLVTHWQGAGNNVRAAEYAVRGADQAAATLAFDHAATLYRLALDLNAPAEKAAIALNVKLAEALTNAGRAAEAGRVYLDTAKSAAAFESLDFRRRAAEQLTMSGHMAEGIALGDEVLRACGYRNPKSRFAIILAIIYYSFVLKIRGLRFVPRAEKDIDRTELLRFDCLHSSGIAFAMSDHVRGKAFQVQTLVEALRLGESTRVARSLGLYAAGGMSAGEVAFAKTMEHQARVRKMAEEAKSPFLQALASLVAGYAYHLTGRWPEAKAAFVHAEETWRDQCVGATYEVNSIRLFLNRALACLGDVRELEQRAGANLREAERRNDLYTIVNVRSSPMVFLALVRDDAADAQKEIDLATPQLAKEGLFFQHFFCLLAQSYVWLYSGEPEKVAARMTEIWPDVKRSLLLHVQNVRILLADSRARAAVSLAAKGGEGSARALRDASKYIRSVEREDGQWSNAQAKLLRAGLANIAGRKDEAASLLEAAEASFAALTMRVQSAVARRQRGLLLGGADGKKLVDSAEAWMREIGIANPARITAFYSPGFGPQVSAPTAPSAATGLT